MNARGPIQATVLAGAIFAAGACGIGAYRLYPAIAPKRLVVENRTDHQVTVQIGTSYHMEVAPLSRAVLDTGWFPFTGRVSVESKQCDFDEAVKDALVVDAAGAHCHDVRSDYPPYPTPVPP